MRTIRPVAGILLVLSLLANARAEEPAKDETLQVICPALGVHGGGVPVGGRASPASIGALGVGVDLELVLLGTCRLFEGGKCVLDIEEVLYGATSAKSLAFVDKPIIIKPEGEKPVVLTERPCTASGRQIVSLGFRPPPEDGWSILRDRFSSCPATPENLAGARAMAEARLAFRALAARSIFVGQVTGRVPPGPPSDPLFDGVPGAKATRLCEVRVSHVLGGPESLGGKSLALRLPETVARRNMLPESRRDEIYFLRRRAHGDEGYRVEGPPLPASLADRVSVMLTMRDRHPVIVVEHEGETLRYREILFQGSVAEALVFIGCRNEGTERLARRFLVRNRETARAAVVAAIRELLFEFTRGKHARHCRLRNLIEVLDRIEVKAPKGDLDQLIESLIAHMAGTKPRTDVAVADPVRGHKVFGTDVNRSLVWLLLALGRDAARERFGGRLADLEKTVPDGWKPLIRDAIDVLNRQ
jgi:hypothetical protein